MSLVLDTSVALAWCFRDEANEASDAVFRRVVREGAVVPPTWRFEVANGLQMAVKRKRIDSVYRDESLADLTKLAVSVDQESDSRVFSATVKVADNHGLTVYDAAFLELALRRRLELATLDVALARAARKERVPVIGS